MALRLVNNAPGESTDAFKPGQYVHLGVKSETLKVQLASTLVAMGMTNVAHHAVLPETDTALTEIGAEVVLETSERRRPIDGTTSRSISSGNLLFTKSNTADGELGIYEVKIPIKPNASCLASFKFKTKTAWTPFTADWCNLSNMIGMYFGLEHGTFNTAAYAFLRANSLDGSLVVGGPLQAYNTARPGQVEILPTAPHAATPGFAWRSIANNSSVEIYIFFNVEGYSTAPLTGVPTNTPLVEIWTKVPADTSPVVQAYIPVGSFGTFPSSLVNPPFTNSRLGTSEFATVFFGNIAQTGGSDILELEDWAIYPDFRLSVVQGIERSNHNFTAFPDAPVEFLSKNNKTPFESIPGRWFPETGGGWIAPALSLHYQSGRRLQATHTVIPKLVTGLTAIHKTEPRFEERLDGIMIEAVISGEVVEASGEGTGIGFAVDDGLKLYQVMAVESDSRKYWGIVKDASQLTVAADGYHLPTEATDFTSPRLVRLVVDRLRPVGIGGGKAELYVDEELLLTKDLSADTFPNAANAVGHARVGHLGITTAKSNTKLAVLNYLPRYLAWEGVDAILPNNAGIDTRVRFTLDSNGAGSQVMTGSDVVISKTALGGSTHYFMKKAQTMAEVDGTLVDFKVAVTSYADLNGTAFAPSIASGVNLTVYLGNKRVEVGFYDCGIHGRHVGILPGSGTAEDIINQTVLGSSFSAPYDWTQPTQYRLIVKGKDRTELVIGPSTNPASITIPWRDDTDGFDLPLDVTAAGILFGHVENDTTSVSKWRFVRWGLSNGFETAIQQEYPNGYPKYLFGGRLLVKSEIDEA